MKRFRFPDVSLMTGLGLGISSIWSSLKRLDSHHVLHLYLSVLELKFSQHQSFFYAQPGCIPRSC